MACSSFEMACLVSVRDTWKYMVYSTLALGKEREIVKEETALIRKEYAVMYTCICTCTAVHGTVCGVSGFVLCCVALSSFLSECLAYSRMYIHEYIHVCMYSTFMKLYICTHTKVLY